MRSKLQGILTWGHQLHRQGVMDPHHLNNLRNVCSLASEGSDEVIEKVYKNWVSKLTILSKKVPARRLG